MPNILDLDLSELKELMDSWGQSTYRAIQIWEGLYKQFWYRSDQFSSLPSSLRNRMVDYFTVIPQGDDLSPLKPIQELKSTDGETIKTLFRLPDHHAIETVLMRYAKRRTLCISTQVGCAMGCVFCATGQMGFRRHLSRGEIASQVLYYARQLATQGEQVTNVVIMGMGEPFHNYEATMAAIDQLNDPLGYNFGARRFTISTVGIIPAIQRFTREKRQVNLAISLHAADNDLRSSLLPINNTYPLDQLIATCKAYTANTHRRISIEWALINGINDSSSHAQQLAGLLQSFKYGSSILCHVNIIPLNPTKKFSGGPTTRQRATTFASELERKGIPCTIRLRRGIDIQAGCGQLATINL